LGQNALHLAARRANPGVMSLLLETGAYNVNDTTVVSAHSQNYFKDDTPQTVLWIVLADMNDLRKPPPGAYFFQKERHEQCVTLLAKNPETRLSFVLENEVLRCCVPLLFPFIQERCMRVLCQTLRARCPEQLIVPLQVLVASYATPNAHEIHDMTQMLRVYDSL
jgi:hypothetical protein